MAQASGSEKRQRTHAVAVRLTPAEAANLNEAAQRAGLSTGAFLRTVALGSAGPRAARRPPVEKIELLRLLAALGMAGSNINQLARLANSTGTVPEAAQLAHIQLEVMDIRDAVLGALGRRS